MATIVSASVEANGWVLALTINGALSSTFVSGFSLATDTMAQWVTNFAAYALTPNATPKLTLTGTRTGFTPSGGVVVASAAVAGSWIATRVLRKAVVATSAGVRDAKNPDEVPGGTGQIVVRIALSGPVYRSSDGDGATLTLTALPGWWLGSGAATGTETISVTNNSTLVAPQPIVRWTDVPNQLQSGSFTLECAVASHHPSGVAPVAGVRFSVYDGTTLKNSFWALALSTSAAYSAGGTGLGLRVYSVTVDPTTATALTKGLLRCDFKVFPWVGKARSSDIGDTNLTSVAASNTPSMTGLATAGLATGSQVPFVVAYNPGNAWITPLFVDIDTTTGTATVASVTVATTAAGAAAGTAAIDLGTAMNALRAQGVTLSAQHGQSAASFSCDGATITIRKTSAAIVGVGTAVTAGVTTTASWLTVRGDPTDATGRACILRTPASNANLVVTMVHATGLSVEAGGAEFAGAHAWLDNFECRGQTGYTSSGGYPPFGGSGVLVWATNGKYWQQTAGLAYVSYSVPVLARNVSVEKSIAAPGVFNCARLSTAATVSGAASNPALASAGGAVTDAGFALDRMAIGNDFRYVASVTSGPAFNMQTLAYASAPAGLQLGKGSAYGINSRHAWINNVVELYAGGNAIWIGVGEDLQSVSTENIIEGNTFTGDRVGMWYNEPVGATIALTDAYDNVAQVNRVANNIMIAIGAKADNYNESTAGAGAQRIGVALGAAATRSKAYAVGDELVLITSVGVSSNVYHCITAGTSASSGGPTGTAADITDGTVHWAYFATETRQHGYRPQAQGCWPVTYGVGFEGNIDLNSISSYPGDRVAPEFFGVGSRSLWDDIYREPTSPATTAPSATPFTSDKSGGTNAQPWQSNWSAAAGGGGNYKPLTTGTALLILGRAKTANSDVDQRGVARGMPFSAGAVDGGVTSTITANGLTSVTLLAVPGTLRTRPAAGAALTTATLLAVPGTAATRPRAAAAMSAAVRLGLPSASASRVVAAAASATVVRLGVPGASRTASRAPAALMTAALFAMPVALAARSLAGAALVAPVRAAGVTASRVRTVGAAGLSVGVLAAPVVGHAVRGVVAMPLYATMALAAPGAGFTKAAVPTALTASSLLGMPVSTAVFAPAVVRPDRFLELASGDGRTSFLGGVGGGAWYRVHRLGLWTIDLDPAAVVAVGIDWTGMFDGPVTVATTVVPDDGALVVSRVAASTSQVVFQATGGGGVVRFDVSHNSGVEVVRVRLRSRATT